ncbi:MAG: polyprenyl synthetase family protein [Gemmatimonadota bacterium]|nr:polyprenyl synthetase family protein [Gemmatimonadota bacterium]
MTVRAVDALERSAITSVVTLEHIQASVADDLHSVRTGMERAITRDIPMLALAARHLLAMRGKMLRPTLVLLANQTAGTPSPDAIVIASVVELVHLATLVHDDAVDHSMLRRGMPTINSLFSDQISVIMGDYLYSTALAQLVSLENIPAMRVLVDASTQMSVGELSQLSTAEPLAFSESDYEFLIRSKTASLMSAACRVGAMCGAPEFAESLREYGDALGMVFQITDDLIDFTEESGTTGKPSGLDLREHKVTLPLIAALRGMSPAERSRAELLFGTTDPSDEDVAEIAAIVVERGGLDYARDRAAEHAGRAQKALAGLPASEARFALERAIFYVMERHA